MDNNDDAKKKKDEEKKPPQKGFSIEDIMKKVLGGEGGGDPADIFKSVFDALNEEGSGFKQIDFGFEGQGFDDLNSLFGGGSPGEKKMLEAPDKGASISASENLYQVKDSGDFYSMTLEVPSYLTSDDIDVHYESSKLTVKGPEYVQTLTTANNVSDVEKTSYKNGILKLKLNKIREGGN